MTQRERLIELLDEIDHKVLSDEEIIELTPEKSYEIIADHLLANSVIVLPVKVFPFCPHCGVKMDGATDNNVGGKREEATP